ncbi:LIM domain transcription factor LMO4, partial [Arapaima gigas]
PSVGVSWKLKQEKSCAKMWFQQVMDPLATEFVQISMLPPVRESGNLFQKKQHNHVITNHFSYTHLKEINRCIEYLIRHFN